MKKYTEPSISIKRFELENIVTDGASIAGRALATTVGGVKAASYGSVTAADVMATTK